MLLDTKITQTMINQRFANQYQLNRIASNVCLVRLANSRTLTITHKAITLSVHLSKLHESFSGPIITGFKHNVIAEMNWMRRIRPYIIWDTSLITLA